MYRHAKPVDWCQCCQWGVALPDAEGSSDFFWNDDSPQIIHSSDNSCGFHISFSFYRCCSAPKAPLCKGGWQKSLISDWGIVLVGTLQSLRHGLRRATPRPLLSASQTFSPLTGKSAIYTREAFRPTIILQITLLVSVNWRRLYRKIYFFKSLWYNK